MPSLPPVFSEQEFNGSLSPEENGGEFDYVLNSEDTVFFDEAAEKAPILSEGEVIPFSKKIVSGLLSCIINITVFVCLALLFLRGRPVPIAVDAVFSDREGDQLEIETLDEGNLDPNPAETYKLTVPEMGEISDFIAPDRLEFDPARESLQMAAEASRIDISDLFEGRTDPGKKNDLLSKYGGNKKTSESVKRGLLWLKKQQNEEGWWSLKGPYRDGVSQSIADNLSAATGLAILAFQGDGNTRQVGEHHVVVRKAWKWLLKQQDEDGSFFREGTTTSRFYTQAVCTIALCELVAMEKKKGKGNDLLSAAQKAVDYLVERQNDDLGGWRYDVTTHEKWIADGKKNRKQITVEKAVDSDLSVTGWCMMALMSARAADLYVPDETLKRIESFLDLVEQDDGTAYSYSKTEWSIRPSMTATGLLCREYLGWNQTNPILLRGAAALVEPDNLVHYPKHEEVSRGKTRETTNVYGWYSTSMALKQLGANHILWRTWNEALSREVPEHQESVQSSEAGSWDPRDDDYYFGGGRLYVTCLSILCMEVYYRHLALYSN